jgi:hypothetical protein
VVRHISICLQYSNRGIVCASWILGRSATDAHSCAAEFTRETGAVIYSQVIASDGDPQTPKVRQDLIGFDGLMARDPIEALLVEDVRDSADSARCARQVSALPYEPESVH